MTFNSKKIIDIHEELLKNHKIEPGFKDKDLVGSILFKMNAKISNHELYPDIYLKAASLFESIIRLHPFVDENKRTALASTQEYLLENEIIFVTPLSAVRFAVKEAQENRLSQDDIDSLILNISNWIKARSISLNKPVNAEQIVAQDLAIVVSVQKISARREDSSVLDHMIDYWIARDIYPETDITFEQVLEFYGERIEHVEKFVKKKLLDIEKQD